MRALLPLLVVVCMLAPASAQTAAPVVIDSRDDWLRLGVRGNGTATSPFVIEGLRIELPAEPGKVGIRIVGVPDHAIVRSVLVVGGETGISLVDARNVVLENASVRRSTIGIELVNGSADRVTVSETQVGILATDATIRESIFRGNSKSVSGRGLTVVDSRFEGNTHGIVLDPGTAPSRIESSAFENTTGIAVNARSPVQIVNSTFLRNGVGLHYAGTPAPLPVTGTVFGNHTDAAIAAVVPEGRTWTLVAEGNWWGLGPDGTPTAPSPRGFGPPIRGAVDAEPVAAAPPTAAGPRSAAGAVFADAAGPNLTSATGTFRTVEDGTDQVVVSVVLTDPDGVARVVFHLDNATTARKLEGETEARVASALAVAPEVAHADVRVVAEDMLGNVATYERSFPREVPEPEPTNTTDEAPPVEEEPTPMGWLVAVLALAFATMRRKEGRAG